MDGTILVPKHKLKGDDGRATFSIRIPEDLCRALDEFTEQTTLSRNAVVTILLREALRIARIEDVEEA
ncbi:MAG: CopG family transcriptional regulator [Firmicutes bacterium]|nr:CopG family transcriptional regulator [Bacillota bacterium]